MTSNPEHSHQPAAKRLSSTLPRVLREFSKDFDRRVTDRLHAKGHASISQSHQVVFSNLGLGATRVTELADQAQVTQQAMGKTLRELENLGYLQRAIDQRDRRAKAISLTEKGQILVRDAIECIEDTRREYASKIGMHELQELERCLRDAASKLDLSYLPELWAETERELA
ncbi:MAG: MarR family transcriptional regulator [Pseudomonadota bacterium]